MIFEFRAFGVLGVAGGPQDVFGRDFYANQRPCAALCHSFGLCLVIVAFVRAAGGGGGGGLVMYTQRQAGQH